MHTFRFVHVGVAAALAAATVTAVGLVQPARAETGGTASSYVPIIPCRLVDTRPGVDNLGPRTTPLGAGEAIAFPVWGTNGACTIPTNATGLATNVTAVNPTASSFITIYPSDANPRPAASNLNVTAGGAPTPNQVTVGLSASGAVAAYNNSGTVDLIIDIVGYYQPAGVGPTGPLMNDDRYYPKAQVDATVAGVNTAIAATNAAVVVANAAIAAANSAIATKQPRLTGTHTLSFGTSGWFPTDNKYEWIAAR